jgi:hypothetical protein
VYAASSSSTNTYARSGVCHEFYYNGQKERHLQHLQHLDPQPTPILLCIRVSKNEQEVDGVTEGASGGRGGGRQVRPQRQREGRDVKS